MTKVMVGAEKDRKAKAQGKVEELFRYEEDKCFLVIMSSCETMRLEKKYFHTLYSLACDKAIFIRTRKATGFKSLRVN